MDWLFDILSQVSNKAIILTVIIIIVVSCWFVKFIFTHRTNIKSCIEKWFEGRAKKNELIEIIHSNQKKIAELTENRIHDREQSLEIQKQLTDSIMVISNKLDIMDKENKKRIRNEMKNRISESYRYYHAQGKWNDMEKEAFDGLVEEYESAGGTNSFVHDTVLPESYTWEVIERT